MKTKDDTIVAQCPRCGRAMKPLPMFRVATDHRLRTCRGCGTRWWIRARVLKVAPGLLMHEMAYREQMTDEQRRQLRELAARLEAERAEDEDSDR